MNQRLTAFTAFIIASLPATAFAEEAGAGLSPFAGNVGNAIWTLVIFVIVVAVLGKFAWTPILGLLKEREQFIHDALLSAKQEREAAAASLKEYTEKLQAARAEADAIITQSRADAARLREELRQKAKGEAEGIIRNAERQIQLETTRALQLIRTEAVELSVTIASKLLQKNVTKEDNERLIDDALKGIRN